MIYTVIERLEGEADSRYTFQAKNEAMISGEHLLPLILGAEQEHTELLSLLETSPRLRLILSRQTYGRKVLC
jgi:hypothetical protein